MSRQRRVFPQLHEGCTGWVGGGFHALPVWGDRGRVEARVVIWETEQALILPDSALFRHARNRSVFVIGRMTKEATDTYIPKPAGRRSAGRPDNVATNTYSQTRASGDRAGAARSPDARV